MKKKLIRLTESDLHRIVRESVNSVLNEVMYKGKPYHGYYGDSPEEKKQAANDWKDMYNYRDCQFDIEFGKAEKDLQDRGEKYLDTGTAKRLSHINKQSNKNWDNYQDYLPKNKMWNDVASAMGKDHLMQPDEY